MGNNVIIIATGSYIPEKCVLNSDFLSNEFFDSKSEIIEKSNDEIIEKFADITEIKERRYASNDLTTSNIATFAASDAIVSAGINLESLDYIIVAHNFGDVKYNSGMSDMVPSLASRVKYNLGIKNPNTLVYDVIGGCPGWIMAMIQANYLIKSGDVQRVMIIGAETISRVSDPHDIDSQIYADGAGATIFEIFQSDLSVGILSHVSRSDTFDYIDSLIMDKSYNPLYSESRIFLKMNGHKLYKYAVSHVPSVVEESLKKAGIELSEVKKILIHQANAKLDKAILKEMFRGKVIPENIMPLIIEKLGNSSVATIPTLLDWILKNKLEGHSIKSGDIIVFASVGAGMNINSVVYRVP